MESVNAEIVGAVRGSLCDLCFRLVPAAKTQQRVAPENMAVDGVDLHNIIFEGHGRGRADAVIAAHILIFQQIVAGFQHFRQNLLRLTEPHQLPQSQRPEHGQLGNGRLVDGGFLEGICRFLGFSKRFQQSAQIVENVGFLIEPGFGLAVGFGHIYAVHVNLIGFRGFSGRGKLIGVKHMHPGVLLGQVALAALVDVEPLDFGGMDGFGVAALLAEQHDPIQIAVIPLRQQLGVTAVYIQTFRHGNVGVFQQLLVFKQQPRVGQQVQGALHAGPGGGGVPALVEVGEAEAAQGLGVAGVAAALFHIWGDAGASIADLSQYINTGKAMAIIAAILLSVALAFAAGSLFMYVSRLIFSFRFAPVFRRWGAVWCGISLAGILYFALFKGLKSSGLIPTSVADYVGEHVLVTLLAFWAASSVVLWLLQRMRLNIMRITILSGTFALALAFAGNDLVNFIGVPLASYDAWQIAREAGSESIMMGELAEPARANFLLLLASGLVMVLTLFFSKKSQHVTETELSLASQHEGEERFGSTFISRSLVRATLVLNTMWTGLIPVRMQKAIDRRFEPLPAEERSSAPYDMIRAVVNLTAASILIAIGTSYQLPLSTTYVVFMVAMGSSLADRTWGRESAVYRITGVMAVISGWFITALGGFLIAFGVTLLLLWGGWIAVTVLVALCAWLLVRSHRNVEQIKAAETKESPVVRAETPDEVLCVCIGEVCTTMEHVTRIYNRTLVAVFKENRKVLKEMVQSSDKLFEEARDRKYGIMPTLRRLQQCDIDTGHFYVQVVDYLSEVTKALIHITRPAYEHINNNHEGLTKEQIVDLMRVNDQVEAIFDKINDMLRTKDFSDLDMVLEMRDKLFDTIVEAIKSQLRRINGDETVSTRASVLYLTILNETKTMILQARNLLKSQHYFLEHKK